MEKLVAMQKKAVYVDGKCGWNQCRIISVGKLHLMKPVILFISDDSYCKTCGGETVGVGEF